MVPNPRCARLLAPLAAIGLLVALAQAAAARPDLWIHDENGILATVDVPTGTVTVIGDMGVVMFDIGFAPDGRLFGITPTSLYEIDPTTAAPTLIGSHGVFEANALVFGSDGTLYAASGALTTLHEIDPVTAAASSLGDVGFSSAGDLAFNAGRFYMASSQLIEIDLGPPATGSVVGSFGFGSVFGLATADDGVLYGVSGTEIFSVDTATGAGTGVSNYGGQGLSASFGSSFRSEAQHGCPATPRPKCIPAAKGKLKIKEKKAGSEKLGLQLKGFSGDTTQASFGDPVAGETRYELCLYDAAGALVAGLGVPRAGATCGKKAKPCWKAKGTKGFGYKDGDAAASGVKKMTLASGPAGKGKLSVSAANKEKKGQASLPVGIAADLADDASVTAQVSASDAACFEATLAVTKADGTQLQAK